jgi:hypothetical protein
MKTNTFFSRIKQNLLGIILIPIVTVGVLSQPQAILDHNSPVVLSLISTFIGFLNGLFLGKVIEDYRKAA